MDIKDIADTMLRMGAKVIATPAAREASDAYVAALREASEDVPHLIGAIMLDALAAVLSMTKQDQLSAVEPILQSMISGVVDATRRHPGFKTPEEVLH